MLLAITVMNFINIKSVFAKLGEGSSEIIMYKINIIHCKPLFHYYCINYIELKVLCLYITTSVPRVLELFFLSFFLQIAQRVPFVNPVFKPPSAFLT